MNGLQLAEHEPVTRLGGSLLPDPSYTYPYETADVDPDLGLGMTEDLASHRARFGHRPSAAGGVLLGILDEVGLTGCGGGHFAVARKWRSALQAGGGGILVANAAESEPASAKDRALLTVVPHLVLDGMMCAAEVLAASEVVLWMHADAHDARRAVSAALAERRVHGLPEAAVRLVLAPARYLSGESSAILRALAGGPALPAFSRRPAAVDGFDGQPAVVHNIETLARIGQLARTGVRGHRPTALVTVSTEAARTVVELHSHAPLVDALRAGGWTGQAPQAVLVGGYGGSWLPWRLAASVRLRDGDLRKHGAGLGAGALLPLAATDCGIKRTAEIVTFLAAEGARQCGPCRFGLPALADRMSALAAGHARREDVARLKELAGLVSGRGGCHHPDGAVRLVASALETFAADVTRHVRGLRCATQSLTAVS